MVKIRVRLSLDPGAITFSTFLLYFFNITFIHFTVTQILYIEIYFDIFKLEII